ncbi:hypothetical protein PRZ48_014288 [Zasmidium cellare]|uniref:Flavodoxin-like domain-containing protein n=1 Tax=Zasmidium cellare TaxID=395010 RepID=A0ABR0E0I4_ZASCE|nr:hypothetical protein PRZ48_014288 [Zasmidium cellare]
MSPKIAIVYYSTYGHLATLARAEAAGITTAGGTADLYQLPETLPPDILTKMSAPPKDTTIPTLTSGAQLEAYDGFLLGVPTRYGSMPAQWKTFWDSMGGEWQKGAFWGKYAGVFVGSGSQGGGQEVTVMGMLSTLVHHGALFVPLGYKTVFGTLTDLSEARGGSPWGAGTFAPSEMELSLAREQGKMFYEHLARVKFD